MIEIPKSLTGTIHLPDARLNFHLIFGEGETKDQPEGEEAKLMGKILNQAVELSPELQELLVSFADHIHKVNNKGQGNT